MKIITTYPHKSYTKAMGYIENQLINLTLKKVEREVQRVER